MSGNAYCCSSCGEVKLVNDVEYGAGDWLELRVLSHVLTFGQSEIREPVPFCSPECAVRFMMKQSDR